jgi:hypothetical protein
VDGIFFGTRCRALEAVEELPAQRLSEEAEHLVVEKWEVSNFGAPEVSCGGHRTPPSCAGGSREAGGAPSSTRLEAPFHRLDTVGVGGLRRAWSSAEVTTVL